MPEEREGQMWLLTTTFMWAIQMLTEDGKLSYQLKLKLTLSSKFQALASLQENEQHPGEEESQTAVNIVWQSMKNNWRKTCEETLERKTTHHKAYVSTDTLKKIEARKKETEELNLSRTRAKEVEVLIRYFKAYREVKQSKELRG